MITCFERTRNNDPGKRLLCDGEWCLIYRVTMHKEYDLTMWNDDFDDIMRKIGADLDGDIITINGERYYVDCVHKIISCC